MAKKLGGVSAAKKLINDRAPAEGFTRLWEMDSLDISVEALVAGRPEFAELFSPSERLRARKRLEDYGWEPTDS